MCICPEVPQKVWKGQGTNAVVKNPVERPLMQKIRNHESLDGKRP